MGKQLNKETRMQVNRKKQTKQKKKTLVQGHNVARNKLFLIIREFECLQESCKKHESLLQGSKKAWKTWKQVQGSQGKNDTRKSGNKHTGKQKYK